MTVRAERGRSLRVRDLEPGDIPEVLAFLRDQTLANLQLIDLVQRCAEPPLPGEAPSRVLLAIRNAEVESVAALWPTISFDANAGLECVEAFLPKLARVSVGLVKSEASSVDLLWETLGQRDRRRALLDRHEVAYRLRADDSRFVDVPEGSRARSAQPADLDPLVFAARESLREEGRPDPFANDLPGFRLWVGGRQPRARVVESGEGIVFVGYADVQRREGWLLQGVYTWPHARRLGFAAAGTSEMCREAFEEGADHVQLSVVEGNRAAEALYERLGFERFERLRTILFH